MLRLIEQIGSFAGLAAFLGLGVFALLSFAHGRDIKRLRDWAGSAPERDAERKEATSTIAAQRAEELRRLEESRTAEHEAVSRREERRRRREAGLPELSRGERLRGAFSGIGERLSQPRYLVALFVVMLVVVGGVAYTVLHDSGETANGKQGSARLQPSEIEVAVLNGTAETGLAASYGNKVEGRGFKLGAVTDANSTFSESVVMFRRGHKPEARRIGKLVAIPKLALMTSEVEAASQKANISVIVGEDNVAAAG